MWFQFLNRTNRCSDQYARSDQMQALGFNSSIGLTAVLTIVFTVAGIGNSGFNSSIGLTAVLTKTLKQPHCLECQFQFLNRTNRCSDVSMAQEDVLLASFNSSIGLTAVLTPSTAGHRGLLSAFQFLNRTNRCSDEVSQNGVEIFSLFQFLNRTNRCSDPVAHPPPVHVF